MTYSHIHREEAENVGDPDEINEWELIGEAPPCESCGSEFAAERLRGRDLCERCAADARALQESEDDRDEDA